MITIRTDRLTGIPYCGIHMHQHILYSVVAAITAVTAVAAITVVTVVTAVAAFTQHLDTYDHICA